MVETALAQYGFEVWNVDNGLPENEVRGITQTPDGYLWIATFNGLARFDGVHLTLFNGRLPGCFRTNSAPCYRGGTETSGSTALTAAWCVITMAWFRGYGRPVRSAGRTSSMD